MITFLYWIIGLVVVSVLLAAFAWLVVNRKIGRRGRLAVVAFVFVAGWVAYPYWSLYRLQTAIADGDVVRLSSSIDWPSVREGLGDDLKAASMRRIMMLDPRIRPLAQAVSDTNINRLVDTQVTPSMLSIMVRDGASPNAPLSSVRYAFFEGSPLVFRADIGMRGAPVDHQAVYVMEWDWGWRLKRLFIAPFLLG